MMYLEPLERNCGHKVRFPTFSQKRGFYNISGFQPAAGRQPARGRPTADRATGVDTCPMDAPPASRSKLQGSARVRWPPAEIGDTSRCKIESPSQDFDRVQAGVETHQATSRRQSRQPATAVSSMKTQKAKVQSFPDCERKQGISLRCSVLMLGIAGPMGPRRVGVQSAEPFAQ